MSSVSIVRSPPKNKKCGNRSYRTEKRNSDCRQTKLKQKTEKKTISLSEWSALLPNASRIVNAKGYNTPLVIIVFFIKLCLA